MENIEVTLSPNTYNQLMDYLYERPYKEVYTLIGKIANDYKESKSVVNVDVAVKAMSQPKPPVSKVLR